MRIVADAGKIDDITQLGGFRIYLIEQENIPSYCENFEGRVQSCERHFHFRRYQESLIPTYFRALRSRENLESKTSKENAEIAIKNINEIVLIPFDEEYQIAEIVNKIDDIREKYLNIERFNLYPRSRSVNSNSLYTNCKSEKSGWEATWNAEPRPIWNK
jgi:hypothetical protein